MYCHIFLFLLLSVFILACHQHGFPQKRFPKRCTRRSGPKRLICGRWGCPDNPPVGKQATTVISPHPRAGEVSFHRRRPLTMAFITPSDTLYMSRCSSHLLYIYFSAVAFLHMHKADTSTTGTHTGFSPACRRPRGTSRMLGSHTECKPTF